MALSDRQVAALAMLLRVRGRWYTSERKDRGWSVALMVEVPDPLDDLPWLTEVFGEAKTRMYYSKPIYRYVVQDKEKVDQVLSAVLGGLGPLRPAAEAMIKFCRAESNTERAKYHDELTKALGKV